MVGGGGASVVAVCIAFNNSCNMLGVVVGEGVVVVFVDVVVVVTLISLMNQSNKLRFSFGTVVGGALVDDSVCISFKNH